MRADVYREAAKLLASKRISYACSAIRSAIPDPDEGTLQEWEAVIRERECAVRLFARHFKPEGGANGLLWFGPLGGSESREHRITALLLMAAIVEGGDA